MKKFLVLFILLLPVYVFASSNNAGAECNKFYSITKANGISIFVISRKKLHGVCGLSFIDLRRINDFTYIDEEK